MSIFKRKQKDDEKKKPFLSTFSCLLADWSGDPVRSEDKHQLQNDDASSCVTDPKCRGVSQRTMVPLLGGLAPSLSRAGKADLGIIPQIIHGPGGSASPTGTSDSPPPPGATACREPFSCRPRGAASDTAAGAKATVSESKPHRCRLPGAKMHTRHA